MQLTDAGAIFGNLRPAGAAQAKANSRPAKTARGRALSAGPSPAIVRPFSADRTPPLPMPRPPSSAKSSSSPAAAEAATASRTTQMLLGLICFVAGAGVMVIEISANRLLAPDFGNSLYTWTSLIGVILVSFSVGGFLGGWWADKWGSLVLLGSLLMGAAFFTLLIPVLSQALSSSLVSAGLIAGPMSISLLLFALPGILLGAVSPACVRFYSMAGHDAHVGASAGTISMLGSLGSFAGTFLSGFILLGTFGVKSIFLGVGVVLLLLSAVAFWMAKVHLVKKSVHFGASVAVLIGALIYQPAMGKDVVYVHDSFYHRIEVIEQGENRYLQLDSTMEGGMRVKDSDLVLPYQQYWQLVKLNDKLKVQHALFLGAGAFGMPEQVSKLGPDVSVDVIEIDPAVIATGRKYFNLDKFPAVQAHASDARGFVRSATQKYDLVFGDAYNGIRHIPAHLVTKEFFQQVHDHLTDEGVFLMNVISSVQGEHAELLGAILKSLQEVFPEVQIFGVGGDPNEAQNVILLASTHSWKPWLEDRFYVQGGWQNNLVSTRVPFAHWPAVAECPLTDDWNPVDVMIARQLAH